MTIFSHSFDNPDKEEREILERFFKGFDYRGAGYTYIANYIWRTTYCLCWEEIEGYICMAGADCISEPTDAVIAMPLTEDGTYDKERLRRAVLECKRRFEERKLPFTITLIPEHMVQFLEEAFPGELLFTHEENDDEYVYLKDKLIDLPGRALHKKKNHLNYFLRSFDYEAKPITSEMKDEIFALTKKLYSWAETDEDEHESLICESEAIEQIMNLIEDKNVYSVAIYIKGELQAFAIGERLSEDTAVEHFEKANDEFRGLYQLVCREFCRALPEEVVYVNREEDMGLQNLRKAKEALRPERMEKKYNACFRQA